jgi:hypothetical protein
VTRSLFGYNEKQRAIYVHTIVVEYYRPDWYNERLMWIREGRLGMAEQIQLKE